MVESTAIYYTIKRMAKKSVRLSHGWEDIQRDVPSRDQWEIDRNREDWVQITYKRSTLASHSPIMEHDGSR